jgi:hypothetical protein
MCTNAHPLPSLPGCDRPEVQVGVACGEVEHRFKTAEHMPTNTLPISSLPGRDRPEVQVGVARGEVEHRLEGVGGEPVAAVVGHVGHEYGDGVGEQALEELPTLDGFLEPAGAPRVLFVVEILHTVSHWRRRLCWPLFSMGDGWHACLSRQVL